MLFKTQALTEFLRNFVGPVRIRASSKLILTIVLLKIRATSHMEELLEIVKDNDFFVLRRMLTLVVLLLRNFGVFTMELLNLFIVVTNIFSLLATLSLLSTLLFSAALENHPHCSLIDSCRSLMASFAYCDLRHEFGETNVVANRLAKIGHSLLFGIVTYSLPPPSISPYFLYDVVGGTSYRNIAK